MEQYSTTFEYKVWDAGVYVLELMLFHALGDDFDQLVYRGEAIVTPQPSAAPPVPLVNGASTAAAAAAAQVVHAR